VNPSQQLILKAVALIGIIAIVGLIVLYVSVSDFFSGFL